MPQEERPPPPVRPRAPLPFAWHFLCGGVAGAVELSIMYPLDVAKTRQQLVDTTGKQPKSIAGILGRIMREKGALSLYRGLLAPMSVEPVKRAWKFGANSFFRTWFIDESGRVTKPKAAVCGALCGATEAMIISPFEVAKVRMMAPDRLGKYQNTLHCFQSILKEEGVRGFGRGFEAAVLRNAVWNGVYFGMIQTLRDLLWTPKSKSEELARNFIAGTTGGVLGVVCNNPLDVVASRMRNVLPGEATPYRWSVPSLARIAREEGVAALYRGFPAKSIWKLLYQHATVLRLGPGGGILLVVVEVLDSSIRRHLNYPS